MNKSSTDVAFCGWEFNWTIVMNLLYCDNNDIYISLSRLMLNICLTCPGNDLSFHINIINLVEFAASFRCGK